MAGTLIQKRGIKARPRALLDIFLKNEEEAKKTCVYPWHLGEDPDEWAKKKAEKMKELEASKNQPS